MTVNRFFFMPEFPTKYLSTYMVLLVSGRYLHYWVNDSTSSHKALTWIDIDFAKWLENR